MKRLLALLLVPALVGSVSSGLFDPPREVAATTPRAVVARVGEDPPLPPGPQPKPVAPYVTLPSALTVKPGGWLSIDAETNCSHIKFLSPDAPDSLFPDGKLIDQIGTVFSNPTPGTYKIMGIGANGDMPALSNWCIITVQGAQPPPGPAPTPPAPVSTFAQPFKIITVDNAAARQQATVAVLNNVGYWNSIRTAGHSVWIMDSNNPQSQQYSAEITAAGGIGQGVLLIHDANNKGVAAVPLPKTTAEITAVIAKAGGKVPAGGSR